MKTRLHVVAVACALAGCSQPVPADPLSSPLKPGQGVIVVHLEPEYDRVMLRPANGEPIPVSNGTRATAIDDADPDGKGPKRLLKIRLAEGPGADAVVTIQRDFIRPAP